MQVWYECRKVKKKKFFFTFRSPSGARDFQTPCFPDGIYLKFEILKCLYKCSVNNKQWLVEVMARHHINLNQWWQSSMMAGVANGQYVSRPNWDLKACDNHFVGIWYRLIPIMISFRLNTLRLTQNRYHFADICECIFLNENVWILIKISLKFVPWRQINNIPAMVQIMAWRRPSYKPLSEPILA